MPLFRVGQCEKLFFCCEKQFKNIEKSENLIITKVVRTGPVIEPASLLVQGSMVGPWSDRF
jgi:hypothetical protein